MQISAWFVTILLSLYGFMKILNIGTAVVGIVKIICGAALACILAYVLFILKTQMPIARFALVILVLSVFAGISSGTRISLALTAVIISVGINYGIFLLATLLSTSLFRLASAEISVIGVMLLSVVLTCAAIVFFFRIRRFRKGILFLQRKGSGSIGLALSGGILLIITLVNRGASAKTGAWLLATAALCITGLIIWLRRGLTALYRERINERNTKEYEKTIEEKDMQIKALQEDNEVLAKLIHRDNKLLPAMREAVMLFLEADAVTKTDVKDILSQINQLMEERDGIIKQDRLDHTTIPSTNNAVIDGILNYMMQEASKEGIEFSIAVLGDISELFDTVISAIKLETLFADLIENAIHATSRSAHKRVLIVLGTNDGHYELSVQDSGIPFEIGTLLDLGQRKASTRLQEGGSGIGYMAIFDILHECRASLVITERDPAMAEFTKSVNVRFDGKDAYIVRTYRALEFNEARRLMDKQLDSPIIHIC